jgi:hypothetical protein
MVVHCIEVRMRDERGVSDGKGAAGRLPHVEADATPREIVAGRLDR